MGSDIVNYNIRDLQYQVSFFCPGKCVNCSIWKYDKDEITKDEMSVELLEKALQSKILDSVEYIQLTAGEVQLSPKYIEAVKIISKYKPNAFVHTNISGWYPQKHYEVTKECLKYIPEENFRIDISLDGPKSTYEKIRLVRNGYDKVFETLKLLKTITNNLRFVFTIYKENYTQMPWVIEMAEKHGIGYYFEFVRESNFLNNFGSTSMNDFTQEELIYIEKILNESQFINRPDRNIKWRRAKQIYNGKNMQFNCHMGKESIVINPYGDVYPCIEGLEILKMGSLKQHNGNLDALLMHENALNVLKKIRDFECQPCGMLCVNKLSE